MSWSQDEFIQDGDIFMNESDPGDVWLVLDADKLFFMIGAEIWRPSRLHAPSFQFRSSGTWSGYRLFKVEK